MAKQIPIEKFISTKRKQKLSSDEIIRDLHNEGYLDIVGLLASHVRGYKIAAYALLLVCIILAGSTYYLYQRGTTPTLAQVITEQAIMALDPFQCLRMEAKTAREECLSKLQEAMALAATDQATKIKAMIGLAALTGDKTLCENLDDSKVYCETFMQIVEARINADPTLCPKNDPTLQSGCVLDILALANPGSKEQLRAKMNQAIKVAIEAKDSLTCQSLPYEFLVEECKSQSLQQIALSGADPKYCDMISNEDAQRICRMTIRQLKGPPNNNS